MKPRSQSGGGVKRALTISLNPDWKATLRQAGEAIQRSIDTGAYPGEQLSFGRRVDAPPVVDRMPASKKANAIVIPASSPACSPNVAFVQAELA